MEAYPSDEEFFIALGQGYIEVWEEMNQQKAPEKIMPIFLGFFLWHNVINASTD